jgi:imidazoleglycerol-phosphate dehydratase
VKIAFVLFEGMTALDIIGIYDPLTRLKSMEFLPDLAWDLCACSEVVKDSNGLEIRPTKVNESLAEYDLVVVPGGPGTRKLVHDPGFLAWLGNAVESRQIASVCTGALLLAAIGLLKDRAAATHPDTRKDLQEMGIRVVNQRIVDEGKILTCGGVTAGIDLGLYLCQQIAGQEAAEKIRGKMDYPYPLPQVYKSSNRFGLNQRRTSTVSRQTQETKIEVSLNLDGSGLHEIETGIPFLDHMVTQIAVHGVFDIDLRARGDLNIDPHHTLEDTALAVGQAFQEALGNRKGIVRMGSAFCPMDESLALSVVDFSGRPYSVIKVDWNEPTVGGIPASLIAHFFESFAIQARCNLHTQVIYGGDDHHKAEAMFKAFGRALDAASRVDERRTGQLPSSKGYLA